MLTKKEKERKNGHFPKEKSGESSRRRQELSQALKGSITWQRIESGLQRRQKHGKRPQQNQELASSGNNEQTYCFKQRIHLVKWLEKKFAK